MTRPAPTPRGRPRRPLRAQSGSGARGVALILVLVTLAILTAMGVDFSYNSRVDLRLAQNSRDELRAEYLARSAINIARLLLHFQKQVDGLGAGIDKALFGLTGQTPPPPPPPGKTPPSPNPAAGSTPSAQPQGPTLGIRLWELMPVDSNLIFSALAGLKDAGSDEAKKADRSEESASGETSPPATFGGFEGTFKARIEDENSRINVAQLGGLQTQQGIAFNQLMALVADPKYDWIFDREDQNGDKVTRADLFLALTDWVDGSDQSATFDPTSKDYPVRVAGFGDKNGPYARYSPSYKAKNALPDSLEELHMVRGVSDAFMETFGDRITVWSGRDAKLNINTDDPQQLAADLRVIAANPLDARLNDPKLIDTVRTELKLRKSFSFFALSVKDFVGIVQRLGIPVRRELSDASTLQTQSLLTDRSDTFRVTAVGRVGKVEKRITTVIKYDDLLGKLLYWKED